MNLTSTAFQVTLSLCFALAITLLFVSTSANGAYEDGDALGLGGSGSNRKSRSILFKLFGGLIFALGEVLSTLPMGKFRENLKKKLIQAGNPAGLSADQFNATRAIAIVFAVMAGLFIDGEISTTPVITLGLATLGIVYPDIWLSGVIQKRRRRIFRDLPDTLDSLRLAVDAGLDLSSAVKVVVEQGKKGPLLDELEKVERDMALGLTRREALRNFADRLGMTEINSFVLALIQADQLGASIGPILKIQSEVARTRRWQLAETLVNKMPMKMLGPLVIFIFPSSFIILFTPLLIQWMQAE